MALKLQFLRDAQALLKQAGQFLAANGLTQCDVHKNESGMAGSGEVYGEYWKPEDPGRRVHVCVESSCVDRAREDGVILYARTQPYKLEATAARKISRNGVAPDKAAQTSGCRRRSMPRSWPMYSDDLRTGHQPGHGIGAHVVYRHSGISSTVHHRREPGPPGSRRIGISMLPCGPMPEPRG